MKSVRRLVELRQVKSPQEIRWSVLLKEIDRIRGEMSSDGRVPDEIAHNTRFGLLASRELEDDVELSEALFQLDKILNFRHDT